MKSNTVLSTAAGWCGRLVALLLVLASQVGAQEKTFAPRAPASVDGRRRTLKELRDQYVVKQEFDYSCGAAALATLMRYYFGDHVTEYEILKLLESRLGVEKQNRKIARGFSLLDLKYAAESRGYRAAGFTLTMDQARQLAAPVIVHVIPLGYRHFAVLRGIIDDRVFLADPARGNMRISVDRFRKEWDGVVFVLGRPGEDAIEGYPLALPRHGDTGSPVPRLSGLLDIGLTYTDVARRLRAR